MAKRRKQYGGYLALRLLRVDERSPQSTVLPPLEDVLAELAIDVVREVEPQDMHEE